jgi:hypothetical protein
VLVCVAVPLVVRFVVGEDGIISFARGSAPYDTDSETGKCAPTSVTETSSSGPQAVAKLRQIDIDARAREDGQDLHDAIEVFPSRSATRQGRTCVLFEKAGERIEARLELGSTYDVSGKDDDSPPTVRGEPIAQMPRVRIGAVDDSVRLEVLRGRR